MGVEQLLAWIDAGVVKYVFCLLAPRFHVGIPVLRLSGAAVSQQRVYGIDVKTG